MVAIIILASQSHAKKPESGLAAQEFRAEIAVSSQYKHARQAQSGGVSEAITRRNGSAARHLLGP
ncbi:MAG: hypothetical protein WAL20_17685 [Rhodomicrobium sp.]